MEKLKNEERQEDTQKKPSVTATITVKGGNMVVWSGGNSTKFSCQLFGTSSILVTGCMVCDRKTDKWRLISDDSWKWVGLVGVCDKCNGHPDIKKIIAERVDIVLEDVDWDFLTGPSVLGN